MIFRYKKQPAIGDPQFMETTINYDLPKAFLLLHLFHRQAPGIIRRWKYGETWARRGLICWSMNHHEVLDTNAKTGEYHIPSGNLLHSHWKWPIEIVDLPNLKIVIFHSYVSLPEGNIVNLNEFQCFTSLYQHVIYYLMFRCFSPANHHLQWHLCASERYNSQ